ncbi:MAG: hypothetical protein L6R28_14030 [Planctomycetes bacterium]|nr:hypothetical protein [Planctomycetota bacterium]
MARQQLMYTLHGTSKDAAHTWATYLYKDGLEVRDVSLSDLGNPSMNDPLEFFRGAHAIATKNGFVGGYPTFKTSGGDYATKHRVVLLSDKVAQAKAVPEAELNGAQHNDLSCYFGNFHSIARNMKPFRNTGYPTGHTEGEGNSRTHLGVFIRHNIGVHTRIFASEMGNPMVGDMAAYIRGTQEVAEKKGFAFGLHTGWHCWPEAEVFQKFHHDFGMRHKVEYEGWRVHKIVPFAPTVDGQGVVHYCSTFVLVKDE